MRIINPSGVSEGGGKQTDDKRGGFQQQPLHDSGMIEVDVRVLPCTARSRTAQAQHPSFAMHGKESHGTGAACSYPYFGALTLKWLIAPEVIGFFNDISGSEKG